MRGPDLAHPLTEEDMARIRASCGILNKNAGPPQAPPPSEVVLVCPAQGCGMDV